VQSQATQHSAAIAATTVTPRGTTPKKTAPVSFQGPLKRTRSQAAIRSDAKCEVLASCTVPVEDEQDDDASAAAATAPAVAVIGYEVAKAGIHASIERSASLASGSDVAAYAEEEDAEVEFSAPAVSMDTEPEAPAAQAPAAAALVAAAPATAAVAPLTVSCSIETKSEVDAPNSFDSENANPNITTTRNSRGSSKGSLRSGSSKIGSIARAVRSTSSGELSN
jgi:hypothetical protein